MIATFLKYASVRLLCCATVLAVAMPAGAQETDPATALKGRAAGYLQAEQANKKADRCNRPTASSDTIAMTTCAQAEFTKATANYLGFVRALGALLRLEYTEIKQDQEGTGVQPPPPIALDNAEAAWLIYRDQTCSWSATGYSTLAPAMVTSCQLGLTRNHLSELSEAYAEALR